MSRTFHHGKRQERKLRLQAVKRKKPDIKRLSRVLIELFEAELEKEARCDNRQGKGDDKADRL